MIKKEAPQRECHSKKSCPLCGGKLVEINKGKLNREVPKENAFYREWCKKTKNMCLSLLIQKKYVAG